MDQKEFRSIVRENIEFYKKGLYDNLGENEGYAQAASSLFLSSYSIFEWLKNIKAEDFGLIQSPDNYLNKEVWTFYKIDNIALKYRYVSETKEGLYSFFTKLEFDSIEELQLNTPGTYYIFSKKIIKKIDAVFFDALIDYKKRKGEIYSKQLVDGVYLNFNGNINRMNFNSIEQYIFPSLVIEINGKEYSFSNETDLSTLLLLTSPSFLAFYMNSNEVIINGDGEVISINRKNNEPVVYHFEKEHKYVLTNSYENLARFNKFIYLAIELFVHCLRVFEQWVITILLPRITQG